MCAIPCCLCPLRIAAGSQWLWHHQEWGMADLHRPLTIWFWVQQGGPDSNGAAHIATKRSPQGC